MVSLFVVFEGPEGSGKTTQIGLLRRRLESLGCDLVCTREPGGTPIGEAIRALLHDPGNTAMLPMTEVLLYSAARAQHVGQVIKPALQRGQVVISDRFAASTIAYQGYGHGLPLAMLNRVTQYATGGLAPDVVIYLDLDVTIGLQRKRLDLAAGRGEWNRMDQKEIAFHRRVRKGYLAIADRDRQRWLVLDATQPVEVLHNLIWSRVEPALDERS